MGAVDPKHPRHINEVPYEKGVSPRMREWLLSVSNEIRAIRRAIDSWPASVPDYTRTYTGTSRTLAAYTGDSESSSYTGIDNAQVGDVYAKVADLNALRGAYENLRGATENLLDVVGALILDLQGEGLLE